MRGRDVAAGAGLTVGVDVAQVITGSAAGAAETRVARHAAVGGRGAGAALAGVLGFAGGRDALTLIRGGTIVQVIRCRAGWCNVLWGDRAGYVIATRLALAGSGVAVAGPPAVVYPAAPPVVVAPYPYYYGYGPYYRPYRYWGWRRW